MVFVTRRREALRLPHAERSLSLAEGRLLACTKKPSRFHKQAFSHAEGSPRRAQISLRACTNKLSRLQKAGVAFAEGIALASTRKRSRLRMYDSRLHEVSLASGYVSDHVCMKSASLLHA